MARVKLTNNEQSDYVKVGTGAYIKEGKIIDVIDHSNYPNAKEVKTIGTNGFQPELCLEIKYITDDYERKMMVFGNFKKNTKGMIVSWDGWNNNVQRILYKLLGEEAEIEENLSIPPDVLRKLWDKEFKYISYQSNRTYNTEDGEKYAFQTFPKIFSLAESKEEIETEWISNLPYIKDYAPEIAENRTKQAKNPSFKADEFNDSDKYSEGNNEDIF